MSASGPKGTTGVLGTAIAARVGSGTTLRPKRMLPAVVTVVMKLQVMWSPMQLVHRL
jgi:hypothetical protein